MINYINHYVGLYNWTANAHTANDTTERLVRHVRSKRGLAVNNGYIVNTGNWIRCLKRVAIKDWDADLSLHWVM